MKITDVEAIFLWQPALNAGIADSGQDDLVILVHTDEGLTGIGEVDSMPEFEALGVYWLEEPFEPDEMEAYAEHMRVDILQPDVRRCGGITEAVRIGKWADSKGLASVPHTWKSGIIKAASLHVNAVLPQALYQEYCIADAPINNQLTYPPLPIDSDGHVAVPSEPGPGVHLNPDMVRELRVD